MTHQRRFYFHRAQPVSADIHHVIDAPEHPVISVAISPRRIACKVSAGYTAPILIDEALRIAPKSSHHARPGTPDNQESFAVIADRISGQIDDVHDDTGDG